MDIQDWFPLGWTGWSSLLPKGLSRVFSNTTIQKHQFFGAQPSSRYNSIQTFVGKVMSLLFNTLSRFVIAFLPRSKCLPVFAVCSVTHSHLTLCNPMDCSTPGFPVHHQLRKLTQTHVYWVGDAIQPSHPLSSPSPPALNLSQHQGLFQWDRVGKGWVLLL